MQAPTAPPRDGLTAAQVTALIVAAPGITVDFGADLIGMDLLAVDDLSDDLVGGGVERHGYNTLHGSASLAISRELDWGAAIVRLWMTISDGQVSARFNLGAYFTSTPARPMADSPPTFAVACYDILQILDDPVGDAYSVDAGAGYLAAVEDILVGRGVQGYLIDQAAAAKVLPNARTWAMTDTLTWLTIVNDLLSSIGYQGMWSDWDGKLRAQPYQTPSARTSEWTYTADPLLSIHGPDGDVAADFYSTPNRWVFYRSSQTDGAAPVEGDGIYTFINSDTGKTSVAGRGGRVVSRVVGVDAADQASLVSRAQETIDADMQIGTTVTTPSGPNPLHWHFDRVSVDDPAIGPTAEYLSTDWTLALDTGDMSHVWRSLS
jgi:hypothetical protein